VLRSLVPIAIGHECSIVLVAVLVVGLGLVADSHHLHLAAGVALIAFGTFRFLRPHAHFRWGAKLQVNRRELGWWSFLMSTVTGAGLMLAPVLLGSGPAATDQTVHSALEGNLLLAVAAALLHATAMFVTATATALAVYKLMGLKVLRVAWINLDKLWALTFIAAFSPRRMMVPLPNSFSI
jgi:hypothetical protein